jgi:DNA-binding NtrC family response regulator
MHRDLERLIVQMVEAGIHFGDAAREFERRFLAHALARSEGSITRCAALTGLHRNTLARKITEHGLRLR